VGKRVLLASYGSGNTMIVISGRVASAAPGIIASWSLDDIEASARKASVEEYEEWIAGSYERGFYRTASEERSATSGDFFLSGIRDDGYREYRYAE
jgi:hydroxymethylglutaryl-CoA synthase